MDAIYWVLLGFLAGVAYDLITAKLSKKNKKLMLKSKTFHIHHSVLGLALIVLYTIVRIEFFFAAGLGIIISHSIRLKRILFVEYKGRKYF